MSGIIEPRIILIVLFAYLLGSVGTNNNKKKSNGALISGILNLLSVFAIAIILPLLFDVLERTVDNVVLDVVVIGYTILFSVVLLGIRYYRVENGILERVLN